MRWALALGLTLMMFTGVWPTNSLVLDESTSTHESPSNPTGVDVRVTDVSVAYTSSTDASLYKMFSSNHPILGFNRPAELYVIDGMVNVSSTLTIGVENIGTAASGVIDVNVLLLHNEYTYFEFVNTTVQMSTLGGGDSNTITATIVPSYAGNHTMIIRATSTVSDDVPSNDALNDRFTVGSDYFNCDSTTAWSLSGGWTLSTDTSISQGRSCHAGNGQTSTYNNNMLATMTTPVMDLSDAVANPTRTNGLSFYYTGSTAANDKLTMYGRNAFGAWSEIGSISGTVDQTFTDGANWQTFSVNNKGAASPLLPVAADLFHSTSQFKYEFSSDATGTDLGFYIDDIVMVYDQKVRPNEYNVSAQGVSTTGAIPGEWGSITLQIVNTGNITETFLPVLNGLPTDWNAYYTRPSGTSFDPSAGLMVAPGAPQEFNIMIQPDPNASIGLQQMSVTISSSSYATVATTLPVQFLVKADRIPVLIPPSVRPSCPPSYTCTFEVGMTNIGDATDVFDISIDTSTIPQDWTVALAWTQPSSVLIRPDETVNALFTLAVPPGVAPDTVASFEMTLQAQNDTSRTDIKDIDVSASMVSVAAVALNEADDIPRRMVNAGDAITLQYTIWNNATRQDIFTMRVDVEDQGLWIVHQPTRTNAVLNAGATTTFDIVVEVPETAQADDRGPTITPVLESQRSQMVIEGDPYDGLRVKTTHDLALTVVEAPNKLTPGLPNEVRLHLTNLGNGPTSAVIEPLDLPDSWSWWITVEGENQTEPLALSVSYDLEHEMELSLWLLLPMTESAGELHTITLSTSLNEEGVDANPEDNAIEFVTTTGAVRVPSLSPGEQSSSAISGGTMFAEVILRNQGNALEDRLSVTASVSSSPPAPGLVVFFTVDGGDRAVGSPVELMVPPGSEQTLRIEVLLPEDTPLNTRFVMRFDFDGAVDEDGLPVAMVHEAMVMLNQRRTMEATMVKSSDIITPHGTTSLVWVNHTSTSTFTESYALTVSTVDGWQVTCDKRLVNATGTMYDLPPGHMTPQTKQHLCEVLRLDGPLTGQLTFTVSSTDGAMLSANTLTFEFESPPEDATLGTTALIGGGVGLLVFIAALVFAFGRRRDEDEAKEFIADSLANATAGPPVSQSNSSPDTTDQTPLQPSVAGPEPLMAGPPLPETGLPPGWTEEQWVYYGQQYLDGTL